MKYAIPTLIFGLCAAQSATAQSDYKYEVLTITQACTNAVSRSVQDPSDIIAKCNGAIPKLDIIIGTRQIEEYDRKTIEYMKGAMLLLTAFGVAMRDNKASAEACGYAAFASAVWKNIGAAPGSYFDQQMKADRTGQILFPMCKIT